MALINTTGHYIKLDKEGNFEIYLNKEAREKVKTSTPSEIIIAKYLEIIANFESEAYNEFRYYDSENYWALVNMWEAECQEYISNIRNKTYNENAAYPLMSEYYPDIINSIPKIVLCGQLGLTLPTTEEAYKSVKKYKTWGETIDV